MFKVIKQNVAWVGLDPEARFGFEKNEQEQTLDVATIL